MRRSVAAAALGVLAAVMACDAQAPVAPLEPPAALPLDDQVIKDAHLRAAAAKLRRENRERGWRCGYREAWETALHEARDEAPRRWRARAVARALLVGLVGFGLGLAGTLLAALLVPPLRRRRAARAARKPIRTGWLAFLGDALGRLGRALGRALRVDYFDRVLARTRADAISECLETERLLADSHRLVEALPTEEGAPEPAELNAAIDAWLLDTRALRRRLADNGFLGPRLDPRELLPTVTEGAQAARALRDDLLRASLAVPGGDAPTQADWRRWRRQADAAPKLPVDRALEAKRASLKPWVRPLGWAGLAALALAVPMAAAWTAAGAFPLFVALLFALAGLGAVLTARVHLFQAGRLPLLPGLADRMAGALTWLAFLMTALLIASAAATTESGLDLGEPPPVPTPDADALQAPPPPPLIPAQVPP